MRTTLDIDDRLLRKAKQKAAAEDRTLTGVVEDALRAHLSARPVPAKPYQLKLLVTGGRRPPAVDIADRNALYDFFDAHP